MDDGTSYIMGWAPSCNNQFTDRTTIFWLNQRHILAKQEKGLQSQCDLALSYGLIRYNNNIKTHHLAIKTTESFIKLRVFPECLLKPHQISVCPRRAPSQLRDAHSVCSAEVIAKSVAFYFVACPSIPCAAEPLFGLQTRDINQGLATESFSTGSGRGRELHEKQSNHKPFLE